MSDYVFISLDATVDPPNSSEAVPGGIAEAVPDGIDEAVADGIVEAVADGIDVDGFNAVFKITRDNATGEPRLALFATKDITAGSELRYDRNQKTAHSAHRPRKVQSYVFLNCAPSHFIDAYFLICSEVNNLFGHFI